MEKKLLIGIIIIGNLLLGAIGGMTYILLTREPLIIEDVKKEEIIEKEIIEPPPLEEEALLKAMRLVGERLRVFDVEEHQDLLLLAIKSEMTASMPRDVKEQIVREVVDTELMAWKERVIRDTLIELYGEYSSEDYIEIDRKTNISQLKEFVSRFEMEVFGHKLVEAFMKKILLVEDELRMRMIIRDYLENEGYEVLEAKDGMEALNAFQNNEIDLILLDLMIPFLDGFGVCREVRTKSDIPIIIITAKEEDEDKIRGFDLGADEYVTKPFSPKVLVARVKSLLKRVDGSIGGKDNILRSGVIEVNKMSYEVTVDNQIIILSPKEYELLIFLIKNKNKVMTRELILDNVWGYDYYGDLRTVDTHIKKLRNKLGEGSKYIKTIIRAGYMFEVK